MSPHAGFVLFLLYLCTFSSPVAAQSAPPITEITLERIGAGPQWSGKGWPQDKIVLRPNADVDSCKTRDFRRLARWLQNSGFFSRRTGKGNRFPLPDAALLTITAVRGGQRKTVYSYNGARDEELWPTETAIRGIAQSRELETARVAWIRRYGKDVEKNWKN